METIKQLEKEIEKGRSRIITEGIMFGDGFFTKIAHKETQLQTLKEVLKEIEDNGFFITDWHTGENFIKGMKYLADQLKQKLVGE